MYCYTKTNFALALSTKQCLLFTLFLEVNLVAYP